MPRATPVQTDFAHDVVMRDAAAEPNRKEPNCETEVLPDLHVGCLQDGFPDLVYRYRGLAGIGEGF